MSEFAAPISTQGGIVSYGSDNGVVAEFKNEPMYLEFESEEKGRPIYKDVVFLSIHFPGNKTTHYYQPVNLNSTEGRPSDPQRFPRQWEAFKNQQEQVPTGTSLLEWAPVTKSQALEMKGMKIHTVEQLAALPDTALTFLGAQGLRAKAQAWLASANGDTTKLVAENQQMRADLEILKQQIANLSAEKEKPEKLTLKPKE